MEPDQRLLGLFDPCTDGSLADDPTCGWQFSSDTPDPAHRIPFSQVWRTPPAQRGMGSPWACVQGFCCNCDLSDHLSSDERLRGGLQCQLFSSTYGLAHCLRMDPFYMNAYDIGDPIVEFTLKLQLTQCSTPDSCTKHDVLSLTESSSTVNSADFSLRAKRIYSFDTHTLPNLSHKLVFVPCTPLSPPLPLHSASLSLAAVQLSDRATPPQPQIQVAHT